MTAVTPENVVASTVCGYSKFFVIADGPEANMMYVPTLAQEKAHNIKYQEPAPQMLQNIGHAKAPEQTETHRDTETPRDPQRPTETQGGPRPPR